MGCFLYPSFVYGVYNCKLAHDQSLFIDSSSNERSMSVVQLKWARGAQDFCKSVVVYYTKLKGGPWLMVRFLHCNLEVMDLSC